VNHHYPNIQIVAAFVQGFSRVSRAHLKDTPIKIIQMGVSIYGGTPKIMYFHEMFHEKNHPAIGILGRGASMTSYGNLQIYTKKSSALLKALYRSQ
jgi:hypothetical protein